jgi:hypothetical protein
MSVSTPEFSGRNFEMTALNHYRLSVEYGVSHFLMGGRQHPLKSLPGYVHFQGALFLL